MRKFLSKAYSFSSSWTGTIIIVLLIIFFVAQAFVIPSGSMKNTLLIGDHLFVKKYAYGVPTPHIPWIEMAVLPDFNKNGHLIKGDMPKRGDIVVFRYPQDFKIHYVKRNFAVGKDEVIFTQRALYLRPHEGDKFIEENFAKDKIVTISGVKFVKEPYDFGGIHYDKSVDTFSQMVKFYASGQLAMTPINIAEFGAFKSSLPFNAFYIKVPQDEFFMIGDNRDHSFDSRFWGSVPYKNIVGKPWFIYFSWDRDFKIRWNRIGRFVDTVQDNDSFISMAIKEEEVDGLH